MTNAEKLTLAKHACHIRIGVIEGTHSAKCGHPGGSLDIAEVLSYLYFVDMNVDPENPKAPDRDRLVLSKGHAAPGLYAALAERGYFPVEDLKTLRKIGSYLQGHPNMNDGAGRGYVHRQPGPGRLCRLRHGTGCQAQAASPSTSTPSWATARWKRASAGRRSCLPSHYKLSNLCVYAGPQPPADRRHHRDGHGQRTRWKKSSRRSTSTS